MKNIISFGTLSEFVSEAPEGSTLRLSMSAQARATLPEKTFNINLTTTNADGDVLVLHWSRSIHWAQNEPAWPKDHSLLAAIQTMPDLIRDFLQTHGFTVRPGTHLIPQNVQPIRGTFDCLRWEKSDDEQWSVQHIEHAEWEAIMLEIENTWSDPEDPVPF